MNAASECGGGALSESTSASVGCLKQERAGNIRSPGRGRSSMVSGSGELDRDDPREDNDKSSEGGLRDLERAVMVGCIVCSCW